MVFERFLPSFAALCEETEPGRPLSLKMLPEVDPAVLYEQMQLACEQQDHPLRAAVAASVASGSLAAEVAAVRPAETLAGRLDGRAVVCVVLARLLFEHYEEALDARQRGSHLPEDELEVVCQNTDTNPVGAEPDAVQLALMAFLRGDKHAASQLASAAYGRAARYGSKPELAVTCAAFLAECGNLMEPSQTEAALSETASEPTSPSTALFYSAADHPFGSGSGAASPVTPSLGAKNALRECEANIGVSGSEGGEPPSSSTMANVTLSGSEAELSSPPSSTAPAPSPPPAPISQPPAPSPAPPPAPPLAPPPAPAKPPPAPVKLLASPPVQVVVAPAPAAAPPVASADPELDEADRQILLALNMLSVSSS